MHIRQVEDHYCTGKNGMTNYNPYIVDYTNGESVSPDGEVCFFDWLDCKVTLSYIPNIGVVFQAQDCYRTHLDIGKEAFFDCRLNKIYDLPTYARPATREEIKEAGLWDYVINKYEFSSEDDELEEYLRLGEEACN